MKKLRVVLYVETDMPASELAHPREWEVIASEYAWQGKTLKINRVKITDEFGFPVKGGGK